MESRQVTLLTQGYLTGRLDFNYTTPLSRLREQFILNDIERERLVDAYKIKTLIAGNVIPINPQEGIKRTNKLLESYMGLTLPYLFNGGKMQSGNNHLGEVTAEKLKGWDAIISEYNSTNKK